ncbi:SH3 domain-containing protein [Roseovarius salinarum]|uniref:SH3 domain-containing protein n=1 Tax=Roseovarius salinarum TaxID=1981892 RepID=UPI0018E46EAB|nr:SH3 domain-containing protein [Roseovarius salinarum]
MWRFIVVVFGFLALAFYELSGGADYAPRPNSLQVRAEIGNVRPQARPGSTRPNSAGGDMPDAPAKAAGTDGKPTRVSVSLDSSDDAPGGGAEASTGPPDIPADAEIRRVSDMSTNLRDGPGILFPRIAVVAPGSEVAVMDDPGGDWLRLQVLATGRVGWVPRWTLKVPATATEPPN